MATTIKKLVDLKDSLVQGIESSLGVTIPSFGKNFLDTLSGAFAGRHKLMYLAISEVQKNIFPDLATTESEGGTLERFGRVKLFRNPFPATEGIYTCSVTGEIGAVIPASSTFKSNDDSSNPGKLYILDIEYVLVSTADQVVLRSLEAGLNGRLNVGDSLTATSPIINIERIVDVFSEDVTPLESETIEEYREKVIEAYRLEAQGGAQADYRIWAGGAQGVNTVYPYAKSGASGELNLYIEATEADSVDGNGTPTQQIIDNVESVIELDPDTTKPIEERGRRPLGVFEINYFPVSTKPIDIIIEGFVGITTDIELKINTSLTNYLRTVRPFIAGADVLSNKNDVISVNTLAFVVISAVPQNSAFFNSITFSVQGIQSSSFLFQNGDIPYLNTITIN